MKLIFYILLLAVAATSLACTTGSAASENQNEVVFDDGYSANTFSGEVVIDDFAFQAENGQILTTTESTEEMTRTLADNSQIIVRYDGYGNKTETRKFVNHSRITELFIRTAANGQKQIYVYGYTKDVKNLPADMSDRVFTASADEIADAAGLNETRSSEDITNFRKQVKTLQPLPSSNFPVQVPQTVQPQRAAEPAVPVLPEDNQAVSEQLKAPAQTTQEPEEKQ